MPRNKKAAEAAATEVKKEINNNGILLELDASRDASTQQVALAICDSGQDGTGHGLD